MTFNQLIKKIFIVVIVVCLSINLYSIEEKDYKNMTARDRILLAISYYEVSMKYEGLKNKALAQSYRKEALKIEQNVEKYYKGELEIPQKTIEIDWNSIFTNDNTDDEQDVLADDSEQDEEEYYFVDDDIDEQDLFADIDTTDDVVETVDTTDDVIETVDTTDDVIETVDTTDDVVEVVDTTDDVVEVVDTTDDVVEIVDSSDDVVEIVDSSDDVVEIVDTTDDVGDWEVSSIVDDEPGVVISQIIRNFFININEKKSELALTDFADSITFQSQSFIMTKQELSDTIKMWCQEHDEKIPEYVDMSINQLDESNYEVQVVFEQDFNFFIPMQNKSVIFNVTRIDNSYLINSIKLVQKPLESNATDNQGFIYRFVSSVLSNDFEIVSTYLYQDVWINEYNMLFPASEVLDHLQSWRIDNVDLTKPEEVVDFETVNDDEYVALQMLEVLGANPEDYQIISFKVLNKTFLPGNPDKEVYSIIVGKDGVAENRILGIAQ